jgi:hypothetical protein
MNFTPLNLNLGLNRNLQPLGQQIMIRNKIKTGNTPATRHPSPVIP